MFDQLFNCPETVTLHQSAPLLDARVRYLQHCQDVGSPRGTLLRKAHELLVIVDRMNLQPEGILDAVDIEEAARRWAYRQPSHYKLKDAEKSEDTSSGPPSGGSGFWAACKDRTFPRIRSSSTSSPATWKARKVFQP